MEFLKELKNRLSRNAVDDSGEALSVYSYDASKFSALPQVVVFPRTLEDIITVVNVARIHKVPITTRGSGTGLTGGSVPEPGGLVLSLERMDKIIHIDPREQVAIVEPGVVNADLQARLTRYGLFFPCEPSSGAFATLGGNVVENACGLKGRVYGSCYSHVRGLVYVNDEGRAVSTGYFNEGKNLMLQRLITGSEGTLGIVAKIAVGLIPVPGDIRTRLLFFDRRADAFTFARNVLSRAVFPLSLEYIEGKTFRLVADPQSPFYRPGAGAVLLVETSGPSPELDEILERAGPVQVMAASSPEERQSYWAFRNQISPALYNLAPDKANEDVGLPIDRMEEFADFLAELSSEKPRMAVHTFGHLSAGCFHVNFMHDALEPGSVDLCRDRVRRMAEKAVALEGTITCEHGVGLTKSAFLPLELGESALSVHRAIKEAFDPSGLFNPGKIFETAAP